MTQAFKYGQRVQIIKGYGKPVGKIVKYSKTLGTYDIQGDDGYHYNCIAPNEIILLNEEIKFEVELKPGEKLKSVIKQFEEAVHETGEVSLSRDQAWLLLAEIQSLQLENERLQNGMDGIRELIRRYDWLDKGEKESQSKETLLLQKGDKLRRIRDGKVFTYVSKDDSGDENYIHVEEMLVPVYLPDFEKVEQN